MIGRVRGGSSSRTVRASVVALAAMLAVAGSGYGAGSSQRARSAATSTFVSLSDCGRRVTSPRTPRRVVVTAVGLTDTVFALGVGDRLVGVGSTDYAKPAPKYARAYGKVPKLGKTGTGAKEVVLAKQPDLVFAEDRSYPFDAKSGRATIAQLVSAGAAVYVSAGGCNGAAGPLSKVYADVTNLGKLLRVPRAASRLVASLRARVSSARRRLRGTRMKVAILGTGEGNADLYAIGPKYTQGAMLTELGQTNVFGDLKDSFTKINPEEVVERDPDAIFMGSGGASATERRNLTYARTKFRNTTAVKKGRVFIVEDAGGTPGSTRQIDQIVQMAGDLSRSK